MGRRAVKSHLLAPTLLNSLTVICQHYQASQNSSIDDDGVLHAPPPTVELWAVDSDVE